MNENSSNYIRVINTNEAGLNESIVEKLFFEGIVPKLVLGFISPHISFESTARKN